MKIAISRVDGGVSVMTLLDPDATSDNEVEKWKLTHPGEYLSHAEGGEDAIPSDRTFRNAWRLSGGVIDHDIDKAKSIQRDRIRAARAPLLSSLDVAYDKADEQGDTVAKQGIATRKQALRDAPADPAIDASETVDELKAVWPEALTG